MTDLDRRSFLTAAFASLAATTNAGHPAASRQVAVARAGRIDVYHHFSPPA